MNRVAIASVPFDANSSFLRGAADGPAKAIAAFHSPSANYCTQDGTDLLAYQPHWHIEPALKFTGDDPETAFRQIYESTGQLLQEGHKILSLGGDHSITFPIIKAHAEKYSPLHLLQIDAHGDLYDNFEDNYYSHASPFARIMEDGLASSLTQIGNRTLNPHQRQQAAKYGVRIIEMKDFNAAQLPELRGPLYISLDLDALDPAFAPGVAHHEPGGLTSREVLKILESIHVPVIGADIVELNPGRDLRGMTAMLAGKLMKELLVMML